MPPVRVGPRGPQRRHTPNKNGLLARRVLRSAGLRTVPGRHEAGGRPLPRKAVPGVRPMRGLPRGLVVVLVLLSASAGWQLFAVHSLLGARDAQLAAFREQAYRQARQVAQLQEFLRARDRKVITLLEMVSQQDQELVELRTQVDRSRVRDRIELARSNLSLFASALEHYFKDN